MLHLIKTKTKQNDLINLVDDVLNENNPFNNKIKAENIYIEDNFFDDWLKRHKKNFLMVSSKK